MKQKILLVEDYKPIRDNTAELLELDGYDVTIACNGKEGLEIALRQPPDLILCDIEMPLMDGYSVLEQIKKQPCLAKTRFVFFTASAENKEIDTAIKMGAHDYIVKPFTGQQLLKVMRKHLS